MPPTHENGVRITYRPLGHEKLNVGTTAVGFQSLPADIDSIRRVVVRNLGQPVCWRDDGINPTGSTGFYQYKDEVWVTDSAFTQIKLIRAVEATGDADCRIIYYG